MTTLRRVEHLSANSLFHNILPVSIIESIFCALSPYGAEWNLKKTNRLPANAQKQMLFSLGWFAQTFAANSLFHNMLLLTTTESRSCSPGFLSHRRNSNKTNTLLRQQRIDLQLNSLFRNILRITTTESIFCVPFSCPVDVTLRKQRFCPIKLKKNCMTPPPSSTSSEEKKPSLS
jgi:hypothetical protein